MVLLFPVLNVRSLLCGFLVAALFGMRAAVADVYQCEGEAGVISLSNVETKKSCKKMKLQPKPKNAPSYVKENNNNQQNQLDASNMGKADLAVQRSAKEAAEERKRIVMEELGLEKRRLEAALSQVATVGIRSNSDSERQRLLAMAKTKESLHRSNIELLEKEYSRLK